MSCPNLDDPLDQEIADFWKADGAGAIKKAKDWTLQYANNWAPRVEMTRLWGRERVGASTIEKWGRLGLVQCSIDENQPRFRDSICKVELSYSSWYWYKQQISPLTFQSSAPARRKGEVELKWPYSLEVKVMNLKDHNLFNITKIEVSLMYTINLHP